MLHHYAFETYEVHIKTTIKVYIENSALMDFYASICLYATPRIWSYQGLLSADHFNKNNQVCQL